MRHFATEQGWGSSTAKLGVRSTMRDADTYCGMPQNSGREVPPHSFAKHGEYTGWIYIIPSARSALSQTTWPWVYRQLYTPACTPHRARFQQHKGLAGGIQAAVHPRVHTPQGQKQSAVRVGRVDGPGPLQQTGQTPVALRR